MTKSVFEEEIYFNNKKIFNDNLDHPYNCICYDGYAICNAVECEGNENVPYFLKLKYPLRKEIMQNKQKCEEILQYRGLYDLTKKDITYGDIMVSQGVIENPNKTIKLCGREWKLANKYYNVGMDLNWCFIAEFSEGILHINEVMGKCLLIMKDGTEYESVI